MPEGHGVPTTDPGVFTINGSFAAFFTDGPPDYNIVLGMYEGSAEVGRIDLETDVLAGAFAITGVGELFKCGVNTVGWQMQKVITYSPTAESELHLWRIQWDGSQWVPLETGTGALQPYTFLFNTSMRPLWISDSLFGYWMGNGEYFVQIEEYIVNNGPPFNYNRIDDNRVVMRDLNGDQVSGPITILAGKPTTTGERWSRYNWAQIGDDAIIAGGTYVGGDEWYFVIASQAAGELSVTEVFTGLPEASHKLIPVEGWTDKILVCYETNVVQEDWAWNYYVVELDGSMSNVVSIPAYSVEQLDFYGEPWIDIGSNGGYNGWLHVSGGGINSQPFAQYLFFAATGDPEGAGQTWTTTVRRQQLTYSGGTLTVGGVTVLTTTNPEYSLSDNEWPQFVAAGVSWVWRYGDDFPDGPELVAINGDTVQVLPEGYLWYDTPTPLTWGETPNLAGAFEARKRAFPRGPTNYT